MAIRLTNELNRMRKAALMACLILLSWKFPSRVEKNHEVGSVTIAITETRSNRVPPGCKSSAAIVLDSGVP